MRDIGESIGAAVVTKGRYVKPGAPAPEGERKLYLQIEGPTPEIVRKAKAEIKRLLEESTEKALRREAPAGGRYSIM
jgi:ATP-dependent RNA helicase DDX46/PRP5